MFGMGNTRDRHVTWPRDMHISINEHAQPLKILLFIRHAWSIAQDLKIPELSPPPAPGESRIPDSPSREEWEDRWKKEWNRTWVWYDTRAPQMAPVSQEEMQKLSRPGQELHPVVPPFWPVEYGTTGFDQTAFGIWDKLTLPVVPDIGVRGSTQALIDAWQDGLRTIIVLPYQGYFANRRNDTHLVISAETRRSPELFTQALRSWQ